MTDLTQIVSEAWDYLHSFSATQENLATLTQQCHVGDTTLRVSSSQLITRGALEIDDELLWVESEDNGTLTVPPFGRGFRGTIAADHPVGSMVVVNPIFPRKNIINAILQTQQEIYPEVYAVKTATFTYSPAVNTYPLPADAQRIISVTADQPGPTKEWARIGRWRLVTDPNATAFSAGKAITLGEAAYPGRTVQVAYTAPFGLLSDPGATLATCGHQESHKDLLVLGACWRLVQFVEPARLQLSSAEAQARGAFVQPGSASNVAKQVYALYQQRLASERDALDKMHPLTSHITR